MKIFLLLIVTIFSQVISVQLQSCARVQRINERIVNGEEVKRGEFPFLVALIRQSDQKFFCGASLITTKHALTASHCIQNKDQPTPKQPQDIIVKLGKFDMKNNKEKGEVTKEISKIIMHEDWNYNETRYNGDIALLFFYSSVQLSEFINIVCLPESSDANNLIEGEVVGYGASERTDYSGAENTPRRTTIKMPPTNENCFLKKSTLAKISSNKTFCAGGENTGPCHGDSGGGFYTEINKTWVLQGIVSASLLNNNKHCDVTTYAAYTNVAFYVDWIDEKIIDDDVKSKNISKNFIVSPKAITNTTTFPKPKESLEPSETSFVGFTPVNRPNPPFTLPTRPTTSTTTPPPPREFEQNFFRSPRPPPPRPFPSPPLPPVVIQTQLRGYFPVPIPPPSNLAATCCDMPLAYSNYDAQFCVNYPDNKFNFVSQCCNSYYGDLQSALQCFRDIPGNDVSVYKYCEIDKRILGGFQVQLQQTHQPYNQQPQQNYQSNPYQIDQRFGGFQEQPQPIYPTYNQQPQQGSGIYDLSDQAAENLHNNQVARMLRIGQWNRG